MNPFAGVSAEVLRNLAHTLRQGYASLPLNGFTLGELPDHSRDALMQLSSQGMAPAHLALLVEQAALVVDARLDAARALEFVWTGPEGEGVHARDTAVVLEQLFSAAEQSVLVSTYVVHQVSAVFGVLARRMDERPDLHVRLFLHVGRSPHDTRHDSELLREFAAGFASQWPGARKPEAYYDPRGLALDHADQATWHAKVVVVDHARAFVTSANFTEWAQQRNVEAGVLVSSPAFATQVCQQFDTLVRAKLVVRVPGL